ncbi:MAG: hypothetical protein FWD61_07005 [Phycisphaerales bacterium]|nr:hypothetical protein [Phycisphaerales bacterium]
MLRIGLLVIVTAVVASCGATSKVETALPGNFYVPSTMMVDRGWDRKEGRAEEQPSSSRIDWYALLPEGETVAFPIVRAEKIAYGTVYMQYGVFTVYTHDWQRISSPRGSGWRITDSVQNWSTP